MNLADIVDWLRSAVCAVRGHRFIRQTDGRVWCRFCRRYIAVL